MTAAHRVLLPNELDPDAAGRCALAIMTKVPRAGRVKTRLTPPLTPEQAAALNVCFLRDTAAAINQAGALGQGVGCYTPVGEEEAYAEILPENFVLIPQRGENFGERLTNAAADLFSVGFVAVCLIDSDSPTIPGSAFAQAVKTLLQPNESIVLGPSDDGGYYLIGMKQLHRELFEKIDWSTECVLAQTKAQATKAGLQLHFLQPGYDVDDGKSLQRLHDELRKSGFQADSADGLPGCRVATATSEFLRTLERRTTTSSLFPS